MFCPSCNTRVHYNYRFCPNCGTELPFRRYDKSNYQQTEDIRVSDTDLIKAYIGPKASEMMPKMGQPYAFNIFAFLAPVYYFAYRKMYVFAIGFSLIFGLLFRLMPMEYALIAWCIAGGFLFYPLYEWDVCHKIERIKINNPRLNRNDLITKVEAAGGTSLRAVLVAYIIHLL